MMDKYFVYSGFKANNGEIIVKFSGIASPEKWEDLPTRSEIADNSPIFKMTPPGSSARLAISLLAHHFDAVGADIKRLDNDLVINFQSEVAKFASRWTFNSQDMDRFLLLHNEPDLVMNERPYPYVYMDISNYLDMENPTFNVQTSKTESIRGFKSIKDANSYITEKGGRMGNKAETQNDKVTFTRHRRITAIASETVEYQVSREDYQAAIDSGMTPEEAVEHLRGEGDAEVVSYESEIKEVVAEHDDEFTVDEPEQESTMSPR